MPRSKFLLVDLNEPKVKKLAETITSDTSRKILEHLADKEDATESQMAEQLQLPLSTVHYHVQRLQEAKLVLAEEFHYSKKGREVLHYKLANKYIVIAPRKVEGLREKLRAVLPVALIIAGIGVVWKVVQWLSARISSPLAAGSFDIATGIDKAKAVPKEALYTTATQEAAQQATQEGAQVAASAAAVHAPDPLVWFLIGAVVTLLVFVLVMLWKGRMKKV